MCCTIWENCHWNCRFSRYQEECHPATIQVFVFPSMTSVSSVENGLGLITRTSSTIRWSHFLVWCSQWFFKKVLKMMLFENGHLLSLSCRQRGLRAFFRIFTSFTIYHAKENCVLSAAFLILLVWLRMYFWCSVWYNRLRSFSTFAFLFKYFLVGFPLRYFVISFMSILFVNIMSLSQGALYFTLSLKGIYLSATSYWGWMKLRFVVFGVWFSFASCNASKPFLSLIVQLFRTFSLYIRISQL